MKAYDMKIFKPKLNNHMDLSHFPNFDENPAETFRGDNSQFEGF